VREEKLCTREEAVQNMCCWEETLRHREGQMRGEKAKLRVGEEKLQVREEKVQAGERQKGAWGQTLLGS